MAATTRRGSAGQPITAPMSSRASAVVGLVGMPLPPPPTATAALGATTQVTSRPQPRPHATTWPIRTADLLSSTCLTSLPPGVSGE